MIYALDTNVVIHYLHNEPNVLRNYDNAVLQGLKIILPKMTDYEIRRGFDIKPTPRKEGNYKTLFEDCNIVDINPDTWGYAIPVYAGYYNRRHTADEMDILIAAICIQNDYTLVTSNARDFQNVDGLKWVDWTSA